LAGCQRLWGTQQLKGKLAAGFTASSLHGMLWVGNPILPEQHSGVPYDEAANRLDSWSGPITQAGHSAAADAFVPGDVKTATKASPDCGPPPG
jgi:NAD(P)H dehydrogenase (quinone)